jgi:hypothetical protein
VFDSLAHTFGDFPRSLRCADNHVLACQRATFSNRRRRIDRMQRDQVDSTFARANGQVAGALCRAFANVSRSTPNIAAGTAALFLGVNG